MNFRLVAIFGSMPINFCFSRLTKLHALQQYMESTAPVQQHSVGLQNSANPRLNPVDQLEISDQARQAVEEMERTTTTTVTALEKTSPKRRPVDQDR